MMIHVAHAVLSGMFAIKHTLPGLQKDTEYLSGRYETRREAERVRKQLVERHRMIAGEVIEVEEVEDNG